MLLFYLQKNKKEFKQFKIKVKHSLLSKEERKKLLFKIFDILLANKQEESSQQTKKKCPKRGAPPLQYLTIDNLPWQITMKIESK